LGVPRQLAGQAFRSNLLLQSLAIKGFPLQSFTQNELRFLIYDLRN
jgi:hypothetical protein